MRSLWLACLFLPLCPALVTTAGADPRSDVFLGYTYTKAGEAGLHGWQLTGAHPLRRSLRIVVDLAGHYGPFAQADLSQLTFMAGARWTWTKARVAPFAEALVGGVRTKTSVALVDGSISDSDTDWGTALGGGVDYTLTGRWAARAQLDLLVVRAEGSWETDPRLSLGLVCRLGK